MNARDLTAIPFTQYLRPDGRIVRPEIKRPLLVADAARRVIAAGMRFECEVLADGLVSLTVVGEDDTGEETDLVIQLVPNGPQVPEAVDTLVREAAALLEDRR